MLTLFRGGPVVWLAVADAAGIGVADNDWVEVFNRNGHRVPRGGLGTGSRRGWRLYHS